jgi:hypothetical protein
MADSRASGMSFASDLGEELDRIEIRDNYELEDVAHNSRAAQSPYPDTTDQEGQRLLAEANDSSERSEYV